MRAEALVMQKYKPGVLVSKDWYQNPWAQKAMTLQVLRKCKEKHPFRTWNEDIFYSYPCDAVSLRFPPEEIARKFSVEVRRPEMCRTCEMVCSRDRFRPFDQTCWVLYISAYASLHSTQARCRLRLLYFGQGPGSWVEFNPVDSTRNGVAVILLIT